ncbi:12609_t:CDS:2 [Gigaspora rosea]|nr:12609_t:CDS:2 [Gigaspora rosea]
MIIPVPETETPQSSLGDGQRMDATIDIEHALDGSCDLCGNILINDRHSNFGSRSSSSHAF